jgi:hypothetical protein
VLVAAHLVTLADPLDGRELHRAPVHGVRAAGLEEASVRPVAGTGSGTGYADERVAAGHLGDRLDEAARVRMGRAVVERFTRALLDDAACVHDRHAARQRSHDGQVVAHVEGRDPVHAAEVADSVEDVRLRRDVEPGRGLVEDDHAGPAREGHRQADPLLLPARELVRIAGEETIVPREQHLVEHLPEPLPPFLRGGAEPVRRERLLELGADADRRVQSRGRILRDVGNGPSPQSAQYGGGLLQDLPPLDENPPAGDPGAAPRVPHESEPYGRLAGARLAHEAEHLAPCDLEGDLVDDVDALLHHLDSEVVDLDDGGGVLAHSARPRSIPMEARENPSPTRLVPIVRSPMAITGITTPQGWISRPRRFSLIMSPQSAAGG